MQIDPHAWLGTLPLTFLMVAAFFQAEEGCLKRLWRDVRRMEEDVWLSLGFSSRQPLTGRIQQLQTALYWMAVGAIGFGSYLSLHAFWTGA